MAAERVFTLRCDICDASAKLFDAEVENIRFALTRDGDWKTYEFRAPHCRRIETIDVCKRCAPRFEAEVSECVKLHHVERSHAVRHVWNNRNYKATPEVN